MIHGRIPPPKGSKNSAAPPRVFRDRAFVQHLLLGLGLGIAVCLALFLVPALYFVEQNYNIFVSLAFDSQPALVQHMEREVMWLRTFLAMGAVATLMVTMLFARRILRYLLSPLEEIEDHLKNIARGHWPAHTPRFPPEAYRSLFLAYDEFHRLQRKQAQEELLALEKISAAVTDREAAFALKMLMQERQIRLGHAPVIESAASVSEASTSRRAS